MVFKNILKIFFIFSFLLFGTIVLAADGSGTCSLTPSQVIENTDTTLTFTFTAAETMDGGSIAIQVPGGWSTAQGTAGIAGYTTATSTGTIAALTFSIQTITVPITSLANTQTITVVYGSGGGNSSARVQDVTGRGGLVSFNVSSKTSAGGTLTSIVSSPTIEVVALPEIDSTPPVSTITAPLDNETITSSSYTITGTAIDTGGSTPAWVQIAINDVWHDVQVVGQSFSTWQYQWTDITEGFYTLKTKSADWRGNNEIPGQGITVNVDFEAPSEPEQPEQPSPEENIEELKAKIMELQKQIIQLLSQLITILQYELLR